MGTVITGGGGVQRLVECWIELAQPFDVLVAWRRRWGGCGGGHQGAAVQRRLRMIDVVEKLGDYWHWKRIGQL